MLKMLPVLFTVLVVVACSKQQPEMQPPQYSADAEAKVLQKMREQQAMRKADNDKANRESAEKAKKGTE